MLFAQLTVRAGQSVTISWNPSVATNVAGYKIYYGTTSHSYVTNVAVGVPANAVTINGLVDGKTYFFAATTYDAARNESALSAEAAYTVPVTPVSLGSTSCVGKQFSFNVPGVAGYHYVVQSSTNLVNWVSVLTNTAPFTFTDTNASAAKRFYRTCYLSP
jgi:fibronectin type 3 domain-containing protein